MTTAREPAARTVASPPGAPDDRRHLLDGLPVNERRLDLAGIETAVLEGGSGPPVVLLHGPGEHAPKWLYVIPELVSTHRVIAPDLPGHGATAAPRPLEADRVLDWLADLLDRTCPDPPALVGQVVGGAIAARYAAERGEGVGRLVLSDSLGLAPFRPAPEFGRALTAYMEEPREATYDGLWRQCAFDVDRLSERMGERWDRMKAYTLDRLRDPALRAAQGSIMEAFGMPPIPEDVLDRIEIPVTLIWGRHDLATPLQVARAAGARHGWPLVVIDDAADDPPLERPGEFLEALRAALAGS